MALETRVLRLHQATKNPEPIQLIVPKTLETCEITEHFVPSREQIDRLQAEMVTMPQAELVTEHHFSSGMYMRKVFRPAGTLIVGKVHKEPHFFLCAMGEIVAWTENGMITLLPGEIGRAHV